LSRSVDLVTDASPDVLDRAPQPSPPNVMIAGESWLIRSPAERWPDHGSWRSIGLSNRHPQKGSWIPSLHFERPDLGQQAVAY